jgi:hypothetical protein
MTVAFRLTRDADFEGRGRGVVSNGIETPVNGPVAVLPAATAGHGRYSGRIRNKLMPYVRGALENPHWVLIFTFGRFVLVRRLLRALAPGTASATALAGSRFEGVSIDRVVDDVRGEGIHLGLNLPPESRDALVDFATTHVCYGAFDRSCAFLADRHAQAERHFGRRFLVGHFLDSIECCGEIQALQADPVLLAIADRYLGGKPVPIATRLWWSFPSAGALDNELREAAQDRPHSDINDWRSIKFFFYLTDVDMQSGAHIFLRRTHRRRRLRHQFAFFTGHTPEALVDAYGEASFLTVCGPAGFGFAEDPFAFHTGMAVKDRRRLILQIEFGVTPVSRRRFYGA